MKSCRTASVFAMGVVVAVMAAAACHDALSPEIPPVTTASPDGAPPVGDTPTSTAPTSSSVSAGDAGAEAPVTARFVDTPAKLEAALCRRTYVAVVKGKVTALSETLGPGDVLVAVNAEPFDATGSGTVVLAITPAVPCPILDQPATTAKVVRATAATKLEWAKGTMSARLDVVPAAGASTVPRDGPASTPLELYLGRLEGTAAVAEHSHAGSWEILAAIDAKGTLVIDGKESPLGPRQIVMVPPGAKHAWKPAPGSKLVAVQMYSPPGPEQRFVALAAADRDAGAAVKDAGTADAR